MKLSLNWARYYSNAKLLPGSVDELVEKIGAQLGAVDEVIDLGARYEGILIAKVVDCQKLENSDHLSVCRIDDGGAAQNVERDQNGHVQVVCGAPNVREGLLVAWLPPGTTVPSTFGKEPLVLEAREIRGQKSNGMLASPHELGLSEDHSGILEVDEAANPGDAFAPVYGLDDYLVDIENKMFTHRPDCFGQLGLARELAGIQRQAFKSPDWYRLNPDLPSGEGLTLEIRNELPELIPRFVAVAIKDAVVKPSPVWLRSYLARVGTRPINNIVDVTNYFMLLTGQPLHAYDYDKVRALSGGENVSLVIRQPRPGEKLKLLSGKEIEPSSEAIMIATDQKLIGIGGVMGGAETEVDEHTKNIILECATFDMYSIRRAAMTHGLFTDAVTRFTKGQSPLQNLAVISHAIEDITKFSGGQVAGPLIDDVHVEQPVLERGSVHPPVSLSLEFINARLGLNISAEEVKSLLENVEFKVEVSGNELEVTAPFWRTDVELREDVVEEVGRLYGYDKLPLVLPGRDLTPPKKDPQTEFKSKIRDALSQAGANELLTYSFVHGNLLDKVGQDKSQAFQLSNALSPDLQYYRLSLTPSLLEKVHPNIKAGYDEFGLFEINKIHMKGVADAAEPEIPKEATHIALIFSAEPKTAQQNYAGAPFYQARKYLKQLLPGIDNQLRPLQEFDFGGDGWGKQMCAPYEPLRSAVIVKDDLAWGVVGEYKSSVRKSLKLPDFTAGFEFDIELLENTPSQNYMALPKYPKVAQDICLKVSAELAYQELFNFLWQEIEKSKPEQTMAKLSPVDIYQRDEDKARRQLTFRLSIASYEKTMTDTEVNALLDQVASSAHQKFDAERI
ncbi:MAG TPA: phenylalanine--tRNA ligase subunit beta [Candidatus Saccharimonadales bacterium]|nr:phenylalanine--tRNA ligase subunit beta [Candidatus Saccharimonadales bacterium]